MPASRRASRRAFRSSTARVLWLVAAAMLGCVPLPVRLTPAVAGQVVDAESGEGIADALVVVRYDARRGDLLPERDLVGHREIATDGSGRFELPSGARPGFTAWPHARSEVRVVGVIKDGYRCARPHGASGEVTIRLERGGLDDRRASCRPVASRPDETPAYHAAWRGLYPRNPSAAEREMQRELERVLEARAVLGFGENCSGPAVDLALSPGGERVAVTLHEHGERRVEVVDLADGRRPVDRVEGASLGPAQRLAWNASGELVVWEPASLIARGSSASRRASESAKGQTLWSPVAPPAARAENEVAPLHPADLQDEGAARWMGRSFRVERRVDPETGLGREVLHVSSADGPAHEVPLPGERCGPAGQYGRPHLRIDASGRRGLDLRFVEGGCRAVAVDLRDGAWERVDSSRSAGRCASTRRVPLDLFRRAVRGYAQELESAVTAAQGDPGTAFTLSLDDASRTLLHTTTYLGDPLTLVLPPLPLQTPLRRLEVTSVAHAGMAAPEPAGEPEVALPPSVPGLEPL